MNNSMKFFKRLTAFLLALLLLTSMMGDDFSSLADDDVEITTEADDGGSAPAAEPESVSEESAAVAEPEQAAPAEETPTTEEVGEGNTQTEETAITEPTAGEGEPNNSIDENIGDENEIKDPEKDPEKDPALEPAVENPEEALTEEEKAKLEEEKLEQERLEKERLEKEKLEKEKLEKEKECEHSWVYVSNGDGTHTIKCEECGEVQKTEDCTFENNKCIHCGYEKEPEECEHEWEYTSNNDGTHTKRCVKCGIEEVEDCEFDEDAVCKYCGYEDMSLEYQSYSQTVHGVKVTVSGQMPRKSEVKVYYRYLRGIENIVNDNLDEGSFTAFAAFDINIYDRHGDKYQPADDDNTVKVTFEGVDEVDEVDEKTEELVVYRIEDDNSVTEIQADTSGETVSFDAEHFTVYATGVYSNQSYVEVWDGNSYGYIDTAADTPNYTRVKSVSFDVYVDKTGEYNFTAKAYKNLADGSNASNPIDGTQVSTGDATLNATEKGWHTVTVNLEQNDDGYVTAGSAYSVVVAASTPDGYVNVGYGSNATSTYISKGSKWSAESVYDGIFTADLETTNQPADSYEIKEMVSTSGVKAASDGSLTYAVGEKDTIKAILTKENVERSITWTLDPESSNVISKTDGTMTTDITAENAGTVDLKGTYNGKTYSLTIHVVDIKIGGVSSKEGVSAYSTDYTGKEVEPTVAVNTTTAGGTVPSYYYVTDSTVKNSPTSTTIINKSTLTTPYTITKFEDNLNVNSSVSAVISYQYDGNTKYEFARKFAITRANIGKLGTDSKSAFEAATFEINNGTVTVKPSTVNKNGAFEVTPEQGTDYTVEAKLDLDAAGVQYTYTITGIGNYTGTVDVVKQSTESDISKLIKVELSSNSRLRSCEYNAAPYTLTENANGGWNEVTFYDIASNEPLPQGVINKTNATVDISTDDTTDGDATNAGNKRITFTMTSGYTGSISVPFEIRKAPLSDAKIVWTNGNKFTYTGEPIEPKEGTDFTVTISTSGQTITLDNTNNEEYVPSYLPEKKHKDITDTPDLVLTSTGKNFEANTTTSDSYRIEASFGLNMTVRIVDGSPYDGTYEKRDDNGHYKTGYSKLYDKVSDNPDTTDVLEGVPEIQVYVGTTRLTKTTDYTIEVDDDAEDPDGTSNVTAKVGTKYIKVTGAGTTYGGKGTVIATYKVAPRPLTDPAITKIYKSGKDKTFNYAEQSATVQSNDAETGMDIKIVYGDTYLKENEDFTIDYSGDRVNVSNDKVSYTITGKGNYTGTLTGGGFKIVPASLEDDGTAKAAIHDDPVINYAYDGKLKTPSVKVTLTTNSSFKEIYKYTETTDQSDNFSVTYSDNRAVGTASITVIGKNNLTGKKVLTFPISQSKDEYVITIGGVTAINQTTQEEYNSTGKRIYYCNDLNVKYGDSIGSLVVKNASGETLNKNGRRTDYNFRWYNTDKADTATPYTSTSPYVSIIGINDYEGNDATVYFHIQPADISGAEVTINQDNAWTGQEVTPEPTVTFKGTSLTKDTDYTVEYFDFNEEDETTSTLTSNAGVKCAVIKGKAGGNFDPTTSKLVKYFVGKKLDTDSIKVTIRSGHYDIDDQTDKQFVSNGTISSTPFQITYRATSATDGNGIAPIIILSNTDGELDDSKYEIKSIESKYPTLFNEANGTLYNSRAPLSNSTTEINELTYTISPKATGGFYGKDITFNVKINPQDIGNTNTNVRVITEQAGIMKYTGSAYDIVPKLIFKFADTNEQGHETPNRYILSNDKDFTPSTINAGTNAGSSASTPVTGVGNFTGERTFSFTIEAGYVKVKMGDQLETATELWETDSATSEYNLGDKVQEYSSLVYDNKEHVPSLFLTATSGKPQLERGTSTDHKDYYVTYYHNGIETTVDNEIFRKNVGKKTIEFHVLGSNFEPQVIKVNYEIKANTISNYAATISNVPYTAEKVTPEMIKQYIKNGTVTLKVTEGSGSSKVLTYGEDANTGDYHIVTDTNEQISETETIPIAGDNDKPSVGEAYFYIKGNSTYSGYLKVPFNIQLDISNSSADTYGKLASVSLPLTSYELAADGSVKKDANGVSTLVPEIRYRAVGDDAGTFKATISNPLSNGITVTRANVGLPGPDDRITVSGSADKACIGTVNYVGHFEYDSNGIPTSSKPDTVKFLANLANYNKISLDANTVYDYDGKTKVPNIKGLLGKAGNAEQTGDYKITYKYATYKSSMDAGNYEPRESAKDVGYYCAVVTATPNSDYYLNDTGDRLHFYIKFNLEKATMKFVNPEDRTKEMASVPYTGEDISLANRMVITAANEGDIYDNGNTGYVEIYNPASGTVKEQGTYNVWVRSKDSQLAYGTLQVNKAFTVSGIDIKDCTISFVDSKVQINGVDYAVDEIKPEVLVKHGTRTLEEGTHYTVDYTNNVNAGQATVTVTGIGSYSGYEDLKFTINPKTITADMIKVVNPVYAGGDPLTPEVTVKNGSHVMAKDVDYTINYGNYAYAGDAYVYVSAKSSNYTGTDVEKKYTIEKLNLRTVKIALERDKTQYTGENLMPNVYDEIKSVSVSVNGVDKKLTSKKENQTLYDYEIEVYQAGNIAPEFKNTGTYQIRIKAGNNNNCINEQDVDFEITKRSLPDNYRYYYSNGTIEHGSWEHGNYGTQNEPGFKTYGEKQPGTGYGNALEITVYDVVNVGGDNKPKIEITDTGVKDSISQENYELKEGDDFTLSLTNNGGTGSGIWNYDGSPTSNATVKAGSPAVTITATDSSNYSGSITLPYNIGKDLSTLQDLTITYNVSGATPSSYTWISTDSDAANKLKTSQWSYTYNGKEQKPESIVVKYKDDSGAVKTETLRKSTGYKNNNFSVSFSGDSIDAGIETVTVEGIGNYCGTVTQKYQINRRPINAETKIFGSESAENMVTGDLKFAVSGLTRMTEAKAAELDKGRENPIYANYVGYYYATYEGSEIVPKVTVTNTEINKEIANSDWDESFAPEKTRCDQASDFSDPANPKLASVKYKFKATSAEVSETDANVKQPGNYYNSNEFTIEYIILPYNFDGDKNKFEVRFKNGLETPIYDFTGKHINEANGVEFEVTNGTDVLVESEDYTVEFKNDILPGTGETDKSPYLEITGINDYKGKIRKYFTIMGHLNADYVQVAYYNDEGTLVYDTPEQKYTGAPIDKGNPPLYLAVPCENTDMDKDLVLTYGDEYVFSGQSDTNSSFTADGKVEYKSNKPYWGDTKTVEYKVNFDDVKVDVTFEDSDGKDGEKYLFKYTGHKIEPEISFSIATAKMTNVEYSRNGSPTDDFTSVGTIDADITYDIGAVKDKHVVASYEIIKRPLSDCEIIVSNKRYTGDKCIPKYTAFIKSEVLSGDHKGETQTFDLKEAGYVTEDYGNYIYNNGTGYITLTPTSDAVPVESSVTKPYAIVLNPVANLKVTGNTGDTLTAQWVSDIYSDGTELQLQTPDSTGKFKTIRSTSTKGMTGKVVFENLKGSTKYRIIANAYANSKDGTPANGIIRSEIRYVDVISDIAKSDVTVTRTSGTRALIEWTATDAVISYYVYRSESAADEGKVVAIVPASSGSYTNSKLDKNKTYYYHIDGYAWVDGVWTKINSSKVKPAAL